MSAIGTPLGQQLIGLENCPHCGVTHPALMQVWNSGQPIDRATPGTKYAWCVYRCVSCGCLVTARGQPNNQAAGTTVSAIFPQSKEVHVDVPEPARTFLNQAFQTLHAPDAAAMVAGSAVDAMLKSLGYKEGSVYARITQAVNDHKLTEGMGAWAHEVRLGSNRPRHADDETPHIAPEEAKQAVEFAEALAYFLFVLTKQIERGTAAAVKAATKN
jgi:Domain of unknown function (DUF4145)